MNAGLTGYGDDAWSYNYYSASHGMASMIITTLVLLGPTLLLLRRWRVPFGSVTLIYVAFGLLVNIMTEYRDIVLIIPLIVTGLAVDLLQQRSVGQRADGRVTLGGIRIVGTRPQPSCGSRTTRCSRSTRASAGSRRCGSGRCSSGP